MKVIHQGYFSLTLEVGKQMRFGSESVFLLTLPEDKQTLKCQQKQMAMAKFGSFHMYSVVFGNLSVALVAMLGWSHVSQKLQRILGP